jgi:antibiotic biosynthesis monooxygenase (ABM) superfamily enzyme
MTVLVARRVLAERRDAFEAAMRELTEQAVTYPGHLGVSVFRPAAGEAEYRILFKFDRKSRLDAWRADPATQALIAKADDLTEGDARVDTLTGLETWFTTPSGHKPPPRPKMAVVTWCVLFPLVSFLLTALQPLLKAIPFLMGTLLVTGLVTLLMTYVIMPRLTRVLAPWLFNGAK